MLLFSHVTKKNMARNLKTEKSKKSFLLSLNVSVEKAVFFLSCDLTETSKNKIHSKMGASWVPVLLFTVIWGIVGGVLPFVLPKGPHKR